MILSAARIILAINGVVFAARTYKNTMRILRNYILKDFLSSFLFALLSLTLVMILGNLIKISDMIIRKGVNVFDAFKIFSLYIPYILGFTIPLSLLMGVLLAMGRLISDNELIAINVAGVSLLKILAIFLILGIIFSLFMFILGDKVLPDFHYNYRRYIKNVYAQNLTAVIEPGVYLENFENTILYVGDIKENLLKNVFVYEINEKGLSRLTYARDGEFVVDGDVLKMKLENGFRDEIGSISKKEFWRLNFKVFFIDLSMQEKENVKVDKKTSDMSIKELRKETVRLRQLNITPINFAAEIQKRISFSFSPLIFVLFGFGVSLVVKHRERTINFGIAVLIAGIYYLLMLLGETLVNFEYIAPVLGMWMPNIIVGSMGIYLIIKNAYIR